MFNQRFLDLGRDEIDTQILAMPRGFASDAFCAAFESNHPQLYEDFLRIYLARGHSRPHAIQIVNAQLMHRVNDRFSDKARKVRTVPNPKGGDMSEWVRV